MPRGTEVGFVAAYNRRDDSSLQYQMGTVNVFVDTNAGDGTGHFCGNMTYDAAMDQDEPYVVGCGGDSTVRSAAHTRARSYPTRELGHTPYTSGGGAGPT